MRKLIPKPHVAVLIVGVLVALFTIASGLAPRITEWTEGSHVTRHDFVNIPDPMYWAFYITAAVMLFVCAWLVSQRVRNYQRGQPDDRRTTKRNLHRRLADFRAGVWMQTLLRDPAAGLMHSFIYFGFIWLFIATVVLEVNHQLPDNLKFLHGGIYQGYAFAADLGGLVFVVGIVWAIARRYVERPYRIRIKTKPEDAVILGTFLVIGLTGFFTEAFRIALDDRAAFEKWSFVGYPLSWLVESWSRDDLREAHRWLWGSHFLAFVVFLVILPTTKLRHMITSPMNMYLSDKDRPKGAMKPLPNLMETELDTFGASTVEDFTWKQLFDTDACTVCGRCMLKLSSTSSTGRCRAAVSLSANARARRAAGPSPPSGSSGSPSTMRSAPQSRTAAAMASRSRVPPCRARVARGCAVRPRPSVTAKPIRREPKSMPRTLAIRVSSLLPELGYNFHMSDQPKMPQSPPQLQIELDEATAQGAYSNLVFLNHNDAEFTFDFVYVQPGAPRARVRSRIIVSPRHAKRFLRALETNIARYEQMFGKIDEGPPVNPSMVS